MAVNDAKQFRRLVLVGATGIKPPEGEIADLFTVTARVYLNSSVNDIKGTAEFAQLYGGEKTPEQYEAWEEARGGGADSLAAIHVQPQSPPVARRSLRTTHTF